MAVATTATKSDVKSAVRETIKQVAVAVSFATLYFVMTAVNPLASLTGAASLSAFLNIRWANLLRGFAVFSPAAIVGTALGGHAWNVYSGKAMLFSYGFTPMLTAAISVAIYFLGSKGKNWKRDVAVLAVGGALTGVVISMRLVGFAMLLDSEVWTSLLSLGVLWKVIWHAGLYVGGYWLARAFFVKE